jgi:hypothetical protein
MRGWGLVIASTVALLLIPGGRSVFSRQPAAAVTAQEDSTAWIDVVALDSSGRQVRDLSPSDVTVRIDGQARKILSLRYVFRGPGAEAARISAPAATPAAADPSRLILIAIDENSILRGGEKAVASAVWRVLDTLAPADRVALVTLPSPRERAVLSTDREILRAAVSRIAGRGVPRTPMALADEQRADDPDLRVTDEEQAVRERELDGREGRQGLPERQPGFARDAPVAETADVGPRTSLQALARLLQDLRDVPGPKTVLYLYAGAAAPDQPDQARLEDAARDLPAAVEAAAGARVTVHVINTTRVGGSDAERVARDTGGTLAKSAAAGSDLARLGAVLSGNWLVEIESRPEDRNAARALEVAATRKGVTLLTARRWTARDDPIPVAEAAPASPPPAPVPGAAPSVRASARPVDPELQPTLARVAAYLESYLRDFSSVVVEEDYHQRIVSGTALAGRPTFRRLKSDLLLVQTASTEGWTPFRDVFEVNGTPVRDREDRLRKLFLEKPETAMVEALRISQEGARYNIGRIYRTINVPTLALVFLTPARVSSFRFERRDEEVVEGIRAWRLDFEEVGRPTVVRQADTGRDLPSSGSLWVDPLTGRIVKTIVRNGDEAFRVESTVVYRPNDALGLWAPAEMREIYRMVNGTETIMGSATYSRFRRFQVTTAESIRN